MGHIIFILNSRDARYLPQITIPLCHRSLFGMMQPCCAILPSRWQVEYVASVFCRRVILKEPMILKSVWVTFFLPLKSQYAPHINPRNAHRLHFLVRVNFVTFTACAFVNILFFCFVFTTGCAYAPPPKVVDVRFIDVVNARVRRIASFRPQHTDDFAMSRQDLAIILDRGFSFIE